MNARKTAELVRKCFCWPCQFRAGNFKGVARAARRFVRMEQAEENRKLSCAGQTILTELQRGAGRLSSTVTARTGSHRLVTSHASTSF